MTIREQIIKEVATTEDSDLLRDVLLFLHRRQHESANSAPRGSSGTIAKHQGTLSKADGNEIMDIINREFNNIEGEW